jgi:hypothetical protein
MLQAALQFTFAENKFPFLTERKRESVCVRERERDETVTRGGSSLFQRFHPFVTLETSCNNVWLCRTKDGKMYVGTAISEIYDVLVRV